MRILAIGDPHGSGNIEKINLDNIDYVLIPGDVGKADLMRKYYFEYNIKQGKKWTDELSKKQIEEAFLQAIQTTENILSYFDKSKIPTYWIYGNVEEGLDERIDKLKLNVKKLSDMKFDNVKLINYKSVKIDDMKMIGIPYFVEEDWIRRFTPNDDMALKKAKTTNKKVREKLKELGKADIILMHNPMYEVMDKVTNSAAPPTWQNKHAGSKIILKYVKNTEPKFVVCGHIHEAKGTSKLGKTTIINPGCNGEYYIIDIKKK
ncbi:MAG: metallophosphoesterase [Candidatus Aenigmarchaeota archaeon]|nr:metallophosphoesterase [Candidatus Aenigmarchaeota archaeon]